MSKYVLITLHERNGEFEYNLKIPQTVPDGVDMDKFVEEYAKNWYGVEHYFEEDKIYFFNGDISIQRSYLEVTYDEYLILNKCLYGGLR